MLGFVLAVIGFVLSVLYWLWFTRSINYINAQLEGLRGSLDRTNDELSSMGDTLLRINDLLAKQAKREERQFRRQADERMARRNGE